MPVNQQIIKESSSDQALLEQGFVVIPFLNATEIEGLTAFFYANHETIPKGLYATAHVQDLAFRNEMNNKIKEVFERANVASFINAQTLGGTFMVKTPGKEGKLHPHQDWNIVDEEEWRSFNVWVPLVDVDESNGTIQVQEGSHLIGKTYRGINIPPQWGQLKDGEWEAMTSIKMKAGEALVYDHRLLHASKENLSEDLRLVVVYGIIPEGAEMRYYYQEGNTIGEYSCSPEFFMNGNPAAGPQGLIKIKDITMPTIKSNEEPLKTKNKSIFEKIKSWIN